MAAPRASGQKRPISPATRAPDLALFVLLDAGAHAIFNA
jgi:hypothetical protein